MRADDLDQGEAGRMGLAALRELSGVADGPWERHCLRQILMAEKLAAGRPLDRDVLHCAAWLHDVGLWLESVDPYVTEGARLAERLLTRFDWPVERVQLCMDACEQHHAPRSRLSMGLEVELIRQTDLVDASGGVFTFGLRRSWLRGLFRAVPRDGFYMAIARAWQSELGSRPRTFSRVFMSPRRTLVDAGARSRPEVAGSAAS